jgi:hypothetical protein
MKPRNKIRFLAHETEKAPLGPQNVQTPQEDMSLGDYPIEKMPIE